jgi:hypothetical protein
LSSVSSVFKLGGTTLKRKQNIGIVNTLIIKHIMLYDGISE